MQVVAVTGQKGGVGKSALTRSLAVQALMERRAAAILDIDPQATSFKWHGRRKSKLPKVIKLGARSIKEALADLEQQGFELAFIDTPPHSQPLITAAVEEATAVLIVTGPNVDDHEQVGSLVGMVSGFEKPCGIIINRAAEKSTALKTCRQAMGVFSLPICPIAIAPLTTHSAASAEGMTAQEYHPDGKAALQLAEAWTWIKRIVLSSRDNVIPVSRHKARRKAS